MSGFAGEKKELNFDLDLLPVISMLSVCICFLLLTAVWNRIGSMDVEQGLGQESTRADAKDASLWITMKAGGRVKLTMMDRPGLVPGFAPGFAKDLREREFVLGESGAAWNLIQNHAAAIKQALPNLKTALIMPEGDVNYGDVITMMDRMKILGIGEIGVAPL